MFDLVAAELSSSYNDLIYLLVEEKECTTLSRLLRKKRDILTSSISEQDTQTTITIGIEQVSNQIFRLNERHQAVSAQLANAEQRHGLISEVHNEILYSSRVLRIENKATPFKRVPCQRPKIDPNIRIRSLPNNNKKKKFSIRRRWCKLLFYQSDIELFQPLLDEYALTLDPIKRKSLANQLVDIVCIRKGLDSTDDETRSQIKYQFFSCRREDNAVINVGSSSSDFDERARILADAKALKESAINYYHPENGVEKSGNQARNYFDRYSAPDRVDPPRDVQIKTISRTDVATIKVNSDDTGREIKNKIVKAGYDVPPSSQTVVVSGKILDDKSTIGSLGRPKVIVVTQPLRASGDTGKKKSKTSKKRGPTGPPPSLNRPAPRPPQRQRPPPSLNRPAPRPPQRQRPPPSSNAIAPRPAPRIAPRAPPRPPPSLNGQSRRLRRVSDEDEMSSHEEQATIPTQPQHIQNEILEINNAAAEFDDVDEVLESISSKGNNVYIIELGPNAKELNVMNGTSKYVRERIYCIYKIGRTDSEGMKRLSSLNVGNFFNLRIKTYKTDNATVMEQFWHKEFEFHNIRGEWFSLPDHLKAKFMSEMAMHEASGCKTFRGTSIDEFNKDPKSCISPEVDRQQWKDEWEKQKSSNFKSIQSPPSTKYNEAAFFSPHLSFNNLMSRTDNCHGRIGVISSYDKARGRTLKGKQCFYLVKVVVPHDVELTPRDRWLLSRVKFGCSDDIMKRFADIQVGCQFDLEMVYFECGDNYVGMEACWKDIFDLQNCRGEWFNVLALDIKLIFDKTLSYIHSSSDLSWQVDGDLNLDELPNDGVGRLMSAQVNSISSSKQDSKIDKLTSTISNHYIDGASLIEHGLNASVATLNDRIDSDEICQSVTSSNTHIKSTSQSLSGGTGIVIMKALDPHVTEKTVDHLGRFSSCKFDAGKGLVTRLVSAYALAAHAAATGNSIEQQHRQYIADKGLGNISPRQLFESDFIKQLKKWLADGEQLIVCMDANEDVVDGDLSKKLSQLGLVEVSHDRLGTDSINTHGHGTRQIDGVWMSKSLSSGLQGVALLPLSKSIGDHRTFIFDISLLSLLGIDTLTTKRERRKSPSIDTDSKSSNTPPTFLGREGNITKSNRHSFTSTYPDEKRRGWLLNWDEQTNAVLLLDDCEHPTFANIVSRQTATYRTGSLQEDELYLLLEGIRLHSSTKWKSIFSDINLGIHRLRSDSQHFVIKAREYLQRVGIWDEMKSTDNGAKLLFRRLGYDHELSNVPKYWWLTLSNEFMLGRVRKHNRSSDRTL